MRWFLSIEESDLSVHVQDEGADAYGSVLRDDEGIEFSPDFRDLHTTVYQETLAGRGSSIEDARPSIELAYRVRTQPVVGPHDSVHAALQA